MNEDKILGTVEGAADRAVASQCQSEVANPLAPWLVPLSGPENRAFCRMARKYRKGVLPESEQAAFFTLRERVRNTMPAKASAP